MASSPRRSFLKRVGLGLIAFGPAARTLAANPGADNAAHIDVQDPSDYFVAGLITGVNRQTISIRDDQGAVSQISVNSGTNVWKGRDGVPTAQLRRGDFFYARGVLRDSTLIGSQVWVNIVNLSGRVASRGTAVMGLETASGNYRIDIPTQVEAFKGEHATTLADQLAHSETAQIIGLWDAKTQRIQATRVFLPDPDAVDATGDIGITSVYTGISTWFCCGPAYGPCGSAGGGACGSCRSDSMHCAWPTIGTGCRFVACGRSLPNLSCGRSITVANPCTGVSHAVVVKDCGPHMSLFCGDRAGSCNLYSDRILDMTPRAFSSFASLSAGKVSVRVTI